jgi:hypothetical protein
VDFGLIAYCVRGMLGSQIALRFNDDLQEGIHRPGSGQHCRPWLTFSDSNCRRIGSRSTASLPDALVEGPDGTAFVSGSKESEATASAMKTRN